MSDKREGGPRVRWESEPGKGGWTNKCHVCWYVGGRPSSIVFGDGWDIKGVLV